MKTIVTLLAAAAALAPAAGCRTNEARQTQAALLADRVAAHRQAQQAAADRVTADYAAASSRLFRQHARLNVDALKTSFDLEVGRAVDRLVENWKSGTLPARLSDAASGTLSRNRDVIRQGDEALAQAREAYGEAYVAAELELSRLERAEARLRQLSSEDRLDTAVDFIVTVARISEDVRKKAEDEREARRLAAEGDGGAGE